jgi:hypothetical protein
MTKKSGRRVTRRPDVLLPCYLLVDEELEPLGLLDEDAAPPLEEAPVPPALLDEPPVPELDDASAGGVLGAVDVVDEEDDPPGTTTVSFSLVVVDEEEDEPLGEVVVDPPGTTVVVSFFSHAASAKAPTSTNKYPLRFISTLLSSDVFTREKCTAGLAIDVPAPGTFLIKDAPWQSLSRQAHPERSVLRARYDSATTRRGRDDRPSPRT